MGCFLDTTIVYAIAEEAEPLATVSQQHVNFNQPASMPFYALREFVAGPMKTLCAAHSRISKTTTVREAFESVMRLPPVVGRTKPGQLNGLIKALGSALEIDPSSANLVGQTLDTGVRRRMMHQLALIVQRQWMRAKAIGQTQATQQLSCFANGDFGFSEDGELQGPNGRFQCDPSERCSAARHLVGKMVDVEKLLAALHPKQLPAELANKNETVRRRSALKQVARLAKNSKDDFPKKDCRALGDAYFAIMCPPGSHVVTTNLIDHQLLCQALGKSAVAP